MKLFNLNVEINKYKSIMEKYWFKGVLDESEWGKKEKTKLLLNSIDPKIVRTIHFETINKV